MTDKIQVARPLVVLHGDARKAHRARQRRAVMAGVQVVRDDLRSKAVHRAGELPTAEQAVEAALAAYRSVGAGRA